MEYITHNMKHEAWNIRRGGKTGNYSSVTCSMTHVPCKRGFALLFAVLASGVLLSIGLAIWNIAFREVLLSSFGRESQSAFYVADSAIECAFYWDFIKTNTFATSTNSSPSATITCAGQTIPVTVPISDTLNATSSFQVNLGTGRATVYVGKSDPEGDGRSATNIVSHGQNSIISSDPTSVERGLRANY